MIAAAGLCVCYSYRNLFFYSFIIDRKKITLSNFLSVSWEAKSGAPVNVTLIGEIGLNPSR